MRNMINALCISKKTLLPTGFYIKLADLNKLAVYCTAVPTLHFTECGILTAPLSVTAECNLELGAHG